MTFCDYRKVTLVPVRGLGAEIHVTKSQFHWLFMAFRECIGAYRLSFGEFPIGCSEPVTNQLALGKDFRFPSSLKCLVSLSIFSKPALDTSSLPDSVVREFCFLIRIQHLGCSFHLMSLRKI